MHTQHLAAQQPPPPPPVVALDSRCQSCASPLRLRVSPVGQSLHCTSSACNSPASEWVAEPVLEQVAVMWTRWSVAPQELLPVTLPCDRDNRLSETAAAAAAAGTGAGTAVAPSASAGAAPLSGLAAHTFTAGELSSDPLSSLHFVTAFECYEGAPFCQQMAAAAQLPPDIINMMHALNEPSIEPTGGQDEQIKAEAQMADMKADGAAAAAVAVTAARSGPVDEAEEEEQIRREERRIARHSLQRNLSAFLAQQAATAAADASSAGCTAATAATAATGAPSQSLFGKAASLSQSSGPFATVKEETLSDMEVASDVSRAASAAAAASRVASRQASAAGQAQPAGATPVAIAEEGASPSIVAGANATTADTADDAERMATDLSAFVGLEALEALPSLSQSLSQSQPQSQPDAASDMSGLREAAAAYVTQSQLGVVTEAPHSVVSRAFSLTSSYLAADLSGIGGGGEMGLGLGPSRTVSGFNFAQSGPSRTTSDLFDGPFLGLDGIAIGGSSMGPTRQPSLFQVPPPPPLPSSSDSQLQMSPQPSMSFGSLPLMSPHSQSQSALGGSGSQHSQTQSQLGYGYQPMRIPSVLASGVSSSGSIVGGGGGAHLPPGRTGSFARIGGSRVSGLLSRGVLPRASFATAYNQQMQMQMQAQALAGHMQQQQQQSDFDHGSGDLMLQSPMSPQDHAHMPFGAGGASISSLALSSRLPSMCFGSQGAQMLPMGSPQSGSQTDMHMDIDAPLPLVGAGLLARKQSNDFGGSQGFASYMTAAQGTASGSQQELQQYQQAALASPLASPSHSLVQAQSQAAAAASSYAIPLPPPPPPLPKQLDSQMMLRLMQGERDLARSRREPLAASAAAAMDSAQIAAAEQRAISRVMALLGVSSALRDHLQDYCGRLGTDRDTARLAGHIAREMQAHKLSATRESNSICAAALYLAYKLQGKNPTQGPFCKTLGRTEVTVRKIYKGDMARRWFDLVPDDYEPLHVPPDFAPRPPRPLLSATAGRARRTAMPIRSASSTLHALHAGAQQSMLSQLNEQAGQSPPPTAAADAGAAPAPTPRVASWSRRVSAVPMPGRPLPPGVVAVVGALRRSSGAPPQGQLRFRVAQPYALDGVRRLVVRVKPQKPHSAGPQSVTAGAGAGAGAGAAAVPPATTAARGRRTNLPGSAREANSDSDTEEDEEATTRRVRGEQSHADAVVADETKAHEQAHGRTQQQPPLKRARTLLGATPDMPLQMQRPPRAHVIMSQQRLTALLQQQHQRKA